MNKLKNLIKKAPINERRLEFKTYALEDDQLIVEGWLKDDKFLPTYHLDGELSPAGKLHRICVRLLLGGSPLSIRDAEAEMPVVPHDECRTTQDTVKKIIGMTIAHGYGDELHKRIGGVRGCAHMVQLIMAMGTAALHGYWFNKARHRHPLPATLEELPDLDYLINSCKLWEKGGILINKIQAGLEKPGETK